MSIPVIPGFIEGPRGERLSELWARPVGDFPDELWPLGVLESVMPEPTGWLTVCEHFFTDDAHGGRGCVLVSREHGGQAIADAGWIGRGLGQFSIWFDFEDNRGYEAGLAATENDADLEFFVQVRQAVGSSEPIVELSQSFLWCWDAYPVRDGWAYVNGAGRPQELVRTRVAREHLNRPGSDGGSGYWFPTPIGSVLGAA